MISDDGRTFIIVILLSVLSAAVSSTLAILFIILSPADIFSEPRRSRSRSPSLWMLRVGANLLGWLFVVLGLVLSVPGVPGQGLLTILMGLLLVDFPGRREVLRRILDRPGVRSRLDRLRERFGRPPFAR